MNGLRRPAGRAVVGVALLAGLVARVGTGPFVDGLRLSVGWPWLEGALLGVPVTVACAVRWRAVAAGLGTDLPLGHAVAACYRSQLLNTLVPGGVVGDVHRGLVHGREGGDPGRGLRAVAWERGAGQVVQLVTTLLVLVLVPSPVREALPGVLVAVLVVLLGLAVVRLAPASGRTRAAPIRRRVRRDLARGVLAADVVPTVLAASVVAQAGLVGTFLVAARAAGVPAASPRLVPLALLVLVAMAIPLNLAGWGPREGMAAWAFSAAGLGAATGVTTAVVYGVLVLVAALPGAVVLLVAARHGRRHATIRTVAPAGEAPSARSAPGVVAAGRVASRG